MLLTVSEDELQSTTPNLKTMAKLDFQDSLRSCLLWKTHLDVAVGPI